MCKRVKSILMYNSPYRSSMVNSIQEADGLVVTRIPWASTSESRRRNPYQWPNKRGHRRGRRDNKLPWSRRIPPVPQCPTASVLHPRRRLCWHGICNVLIDLFFTRYSSRFSNKVSSVESTYEGNILLQYYNIE